jgi:signal transduction histidine kinase
MNELLQRNRLFHGVPPEMMSRIEPIIGRATYDPGATIFSEEELGDTFYLVESGLIRISKRGRGGEQETITYVEPQDFFGEMALLDANPRSARAAAVERTTLGCIDRDGFHELIALGCPQIYMNFLLQVVQRLRRVSDHFISEVMRAERLSLVGSMAAAIIHDLNNPIAVIRACNEMLELQSPTIDRAKLVSLNKAALDQILAMIQELLDFSRGHTVELQKQGLSVQQLLDDLDAQVLRLVPARGLSLVIETPYEGTVEVDRNRFVRVLANLVKNAMQSMPKGGTLTLGIAKEPDHVVFTIADTGGGIPPEIQSRIFEPFVTAGKKDGTGLGMAIAKSVVEAHDGRISVESQVGTGTRITVRLPDRR